MTLCRTSIGALAPCCCVSISLFLQGLFFLLLTLHPAFLCLLSRGPPVQGRLTLGNRDFYDGLFKALNLQSPWLPLLFSRSPDAAVPD